MTKRKVGLDEASRLLGIQKEALRKRAKRGTVSAEKDKHGRWLFVVENDLDSGEDNVQDTSRTILDTMQKEIEYLRRENERKDHIIMSLVQRVPQLEAPRQEQADPDVQQEKKQPWWKKIFGK